MLGVTETEPPPGRSRSEQVQVAAIGAAATVVVAVIGLLGIWLANGSGDSSTKSSTPTPTPTSTAATPGEPEIRILGTSFALLERGGVKISVRGSVRDFPPSDRLYAVARLATDPNPTSWWVSDEVTPDLSGSWAARILADADPGETVSVFALRFDPVEAGAGGVDAVSPEEARASLIESGPGAVGAHGDDRPVLDAVPPPPPGS